MIIKTINYIYDLDKSLIIMNKSDLWKMYLWVLKRMTEEERKIIQATKPHLLKGTERELGIGLKSKLTLIIEILDDNRATGGRNPRA